MLANSLATQYVTESLLENWSKDVFLVMCSILSQITMTTTTPSMTIVCSGALLITMMVTLASTSVGKITWGQQDVSLPPQLILRDTLRCSAGLTNMLQQHPESQMPSQGYANYAMGPQQVGYYFTVKPANDFLCYVFGVCFMLSGSNVAAAFIYGGSAIGV